MLQVVISTGNHETRRWYHGAVGQPLSRYPAILSSKSLLISVYFTGASSLASSDLGSSPPFASGKRTTTEDDSINRVSNRLDLDLPSATRSSFLSRPNLPSIIQEVTSANGLRSSDYAARCQKLCSSGSDKHYRVGSRAKDF